MTSNERAERILEWKPKRSLSDMINSDYKWRKKQTALLNEKI
jgi:UDP-glucose 4-epimerase